MFSLKLADAALAKFKAAELLKTFCPTGPKQKIKVKQPVLKSSIDFSLNGS